MNISVIIPTLNEQAAIVTAIDRAHAAGADEVLVVDGGSSDETQSLAKASDCRLLDASPGRASQMNMGARHATGDVLLFLHADTWLIKDGCKQIRNVLTDESLVWGGFRQTIDNSGRVYRWIEQGNAFRAGWQGLVYGDQGLFVRKQTFLDQNGFPDVDLMEDFSLSQALKRIHRPLLLSGPIHVSARRWESQGVFRQTVRNWLISTAYRLGVKPRTLASWYNMGHGK